MDDTACVVNSGGSRRAFLRRAAIVGAVAWTAPIVLSSTDIAGAVGSCAAVLDWDTFTTGAMFTSAVVSGVTVTLSVVALSGTTLLATNRTVRAASNGSVNQKALQFQQDPDAVGIGQTIAFSFSKSVRNVSFTLYDIDNTTGNGWGDRVQVNTSGYTFSIPSDGTVTGNGGSGNNQFRNTQTNNNLGDASDQGNVTLTYAGPISSFQFTYRNAANTGGPNMRIAISDISFSTC